MAKTKFEKPVFAPITLVFETPAEAACALALLNRPIDGEVGAWVGREISLPIAALLEAHGSEMHSQWVSLAIALKERGIYRDSARVFPQVKAK